MHLSPPVEPMLARSVTTLPSPGARPVLFEQMADGFRVLVFAGPKPYLQSRRGADLGPAFPEITRAAAALRPGEQPKSGGGVFQFLAVAGLSDGSCDCLLVRSLGRAWGGVI
ncbi:hypothetical protein ACGFY6_30550 [Streptomyces sp. NPDC048387]|uniref:hypothetical protein n=1 Tax=Streptomyces sp. NPDC048387 TaxID=3365542 RepID=UPI00372154BD